MKLCMHMHQWSRWFYLVFQVVDVLCCAGTVPCSGLLYQVLPGSALISLLRPMQASRLANLISELPQTEDNATCCSFGLWARMISDSGSPAELLNVHAGDGQSADTHHLKWFDKAGCNIAVANQWYKECDFNAGTKAFIKDCSEICDEFELQDDGADISSMLCDLYTVKQSISCTQSTLGKGKAVRSPVQRKLQGQNRALRMVNVARMSAKSQHSRVDRQSSTGESDIADSIATRGRASFTRSKPLIVGRKPAIKHELVFSDEQSLVTSLQETFACHVKDTNLSLHNVALDAVMAARKFFSHNASDGLQTQVLMKDLFLKHLLKTKLDIQQAFGAGDSSSTEIRECKLQVFLRLEMLAQLPNLPFEEERLVVEMVALLRLIFMVGETLSNFLQEDLMPLYECSLPRVLASVHTALGHPLPKTLARALPPGFLSDHSLCADEGDDDAVTDLLSPDSESVTSSCGPSSSMPGSVSSSDALFMSTHGRRSTTIVRHRSLCDSTQNPRQIEVPVSKRSKDVALRDKASISSNAKADDHQGVRRSLFQGLSSESILPSKSLVRSHSASVVELHSKSQRPSTKGRHRLLTKEVAETPAHKQFPNHLLRRQRKGRTHHSDSSGVDMVEESPTKTLDGAVVQSSRWSLRSSLQRCPSFYSAEQPMARAARFVTSQQLLSGTSSPRQGRKRLLSPKPRAGPSPRTLLFGAAVGSPTEKATLPRSPRLSARLTASPVFNKLRKRSQTKRTQCDDAAARTSSKSAKTPRRSLSFSSSSEEAFLKQRHPEGGASVQAAQNVDFRNEGSSASLGETDIEEESPVKKAEEQVVSKSPQQGNDELAVFTSPESHQIQPKQCKKTIAALRPRRESETHTKELGTSHESSDSPSIKASNDCADQQVYTSPGDSVEPSTRDFRDSPAACQKAKYSLRLTPDRQQRQAEARQNAQLMQATDVHTVCGEIETSTCPPEFEVEVVNTSSGIPRLLLRRTNSIKDCSKKSPSTGSSTAERQTGLPVSPAVHSPPPCTLHRMRTNRTTPPGLRGSGSPVPIQTRICLSLTPTRQEEGGAGHSPCSVRPLTSVTPDAIRKWPRRKRAGSASPAWRCKGSQNGQTNSAKSSPEGLMPKVLADNGTVTCHPARKRVRLTPPPQATKKSCQEELSSVSDAGSCVDLSDAASSISVSSEVFVNLDGPQDTDGTYCSPPGAKSLSASALTALTSSPILWTARGGSDADARLGQQVDALEKEHNEGTTSTHCSPANQHPCPSKSINKRHLLP
uniref:Treslin STD domain-containing protein n=1 Tax=Eptatretus burgeri TaxID=7764 RepID=A0A8C4N8L3_EPTBU